MTLLKDETKHTLTYIFVTISGSLAVVNGLQEGSVGISIAGGVLSITAISVLVAN